MFDNDNLCGEKREKTCCKDRIILAVILGILLFVIGIIVGALTGIFALIGTSAFTIIAIGLGILALIRIAILVICCQRKC